MRLFFLAIIILYAACDFSSPSNTPRANVQKVNLNQRPSDNNHFQEAIDRFAKDAALKHGSASISVIDVASGKTIAAYQSDKSLIPASSLKIIPTATALLEYGKDYKFKTELQYDGTIQEGVLNGNVYIKGYGDPTLGSDQLDETLNLDAVMQAFVDALKIAGIRQVNGQIIGDGSYLPTAVNSRTWQWNDLGNYYASGAWGLNIHENLYYLRFQQSSRLGAIPKIAAIEPAIPNLEFTNELRSAAKGTGDNAYIYGAPYTYDRFVRGTIPIGNQRFSIKGSIPNPGLFAAEYLQEKLKQTGIKVSKSASTHLIAETKSIARKTLYTHQSPSLLAIAKRTNFKSVNLYAEALLRAAGKSKGTDGSLEKSLKSTLDFWETRGWNTDGLFLEDGCGLSPRNAASSQHLAQFLSLIANDKNLFDTFFETLPVGGRSGTLKNMFKGTSAQGKIHAKSGSMRRIRSYSGYAKAKNGQLLAFSIIANNYTCKNTTMRKKMEKVMIALCQ